MRKERQGVSIRLVDWKDRGRHAVLPGLKRQPLRVNHAPAMQTKRRKVSKEFFTPESRQQTLEDHLADIAASNDTTAKSAHVPSWMPRHLCLRGASRFEVLRTGWSNDNWLFGSLAGYSGSWRVLRSSWQTVCVLFFHHQQPVASHSFTDRKSSKIISN